MHTGRHTGEVIFVAVRNKFCSVCASNESRNKPPIKHTCYKNLSDSAPSMEAYIAVEGFYLSEEMHGVRYTKFIANGYSSGFARLQQKVPYGNQIGKIECTNHALKKYGKRLYQIQKDKHIKIKGRKLLTAKNIKLL